jgi:hypothetical protein
MIVHGLYAAIVALAVQVSAADQVTLYTQEPTALVKAPSPTSDVVADIPAGEEVVWTKTDAPKKGWFKVTHGTQIGFIHRASLAPEKPNLEVATKASSVSESNRAIASSGAANKSAAEEAHEYANAKGLGNEIDQLEKLEAAAAKIDGAAVQAHAVKVGLVTRSLKKGGK